MKSIKDYYKVYLNLKNEKSPNQLLAGNAANDALNKIISLQAQDAEEDEIKVRAMIIQKRFIEALLYLEIKITNRLEFYYKAKGEILYLTQSKNQSLKVLQEGIKHFPQSIALLNNCGFIMDELQDYSDAVKIYNKILLLDPNNIAASINKAVSLWHKGISYYPEVIQVLRDVIKLQPNCQQSYLNLGIVLAANKDYQAALDALNNALRIDENYAPAYYNKAKVYHCLNETISAVLNLQLAQKCKKSSVQVESHHFKEFMKFSSKDVNAIVDCIIKIPTIITHLDLSHNQIKKEGVSSLMQNTALVSLDLRGNRLDEEINLLAKNRTIIDLDIRDIKISNKHVKQLITNPTICNLQLDFEALNAQHQKSIQEMIARNRQQITLFSTACKNKDLSIIKSMLKKNLISPHALIEGSAMTALEFALANDSTDLAERLIKSYLKYYQPQLPILRFIIDILHKSRNYAQKTVHIELGIQAILATVIENGYINIAEAIALGLNKLKLENIKIDTQQVQALIKIFTANPEISSICLSNVSFTEEGFAEFVNALLILKSNIKDLAITHSWLKSAHLLTLANILPSCENLTSLNLSGNLLNYKDARHLLRSIVSNRKMNELSLQDNCISICSKNLLSSEFESLIHSTSLRQININSNNFESETRDKVLVSVISILLRKSALSVEQFINSKLIKNETVNGNGCNLIIMVDKSEYIIPLTKSELEQFNKLKTLHVRLKNDNDVYEYMTQEFTKRRSEMDNHFLQSTYKASEICHSSPNQDAAKQVSKQLINYHPKSPLKSLLKTCSIFNNQKVVEVKSIFDPNIKITHNNWKVYLLANKAHEHAMLAYEGLTGYGQRFVKIAHLTAVDGQIKYKFYDHPLEDLATHIKNKFYIAPIPIASSRRQVKDMHADILNQVNTESLEEFEKLIIESVPTKQSNDKVTNCLKWALSKIKAHLNIDFNITVYHPSIFVKRLKDDPMSIIKPPSPRLINGIGA